MRSQSEAQLCSFAMSCRFAPICQTCQAKLHDITKEKTKLISTLVESVNQPQPDFHGLGLF